MSGPKTSVRVEYRHTDGWHIFSSDQLPGLYVASQDAKRAFADVATAIEKLLKLNEGLDVRAEPELSFEEFVRTLQSKGGIGGGQVTLSSKRYLVYAAQ